MSEPTRRDLKLLVAMLVFIHSILLAFDFFHPEAFLRGDRAGIRAQMVERFYSALVSGNGIVDAASSLGIIGDYFLHSIAFLVGGKFGILILQIAASILAVCILYLTAFTLTNSRRVAWLAAITYATLPHTLAFPHMLVTETFANTFVILSVYELVKFSQNEAPSARHLMLSGLWVAVSMLIRPIVVLFPVFVGLAIVICRVDVRFTVIFRYLSVAYLPLLLWMSFLLVSTGSFTTGSSGSTLGLNLYLKVERMQASAPEDTLGTALLEQSDKRVSLMEFMDYVTSNPVRYINLLKFDVSNLILNSGVNKLLGYYLELYDVGKEKGSRWLKIIDQHGFIKGIVDVLGQSPAFIISTLIFTAYWAMLLLGAGMGFTLFVRDSSQPILAKLVLVGLPLYVTFFTVALVSGPRSGHRSSFDFIICLMFSIYFFGSLRKRYQNADSHSKGITV
jgi:hypothetical protein